MKLPTNLIAAGGWALSKAFLSAKAKAQLRDSKGRFIKMNSLVRWKDQTGKYRRGNVVGIEPDGKTVSVQEIGKTAVAKIKPKQLEVIKATIPTAKGDVNVPSAPGKNDDSDFNDELFSPGEGQDELDLFVDTAGFKKVGSQAGSNSGGFYEDPDTGDRYYVKSAASEQHAANEVLAARLYALSGVGAPEVYLTEIDGKPGVASKVVPDLKPLYPGGKTTPETLKEGRKGFAMDAWSANWDSIGLVYDNMMTTPDGKAVRVDTGGALIYRAQGSPKGDLFGNSVGETETLRNSSMNPQAAKIFGGMTSDEIAQDIANTVDKVSDDDVRALVNELPFTDPVKVSLTNKLKARKDDLHKKFPGGIDVSSKTGEVIAQNDALKKITKEDLLAPVASKPSESAPGVTPVGSKPDPLSAPNKSTAKVAVKDFKPGDLFAPFGGTATASILKTEDLGYGQRKVYYHSSTSDNPQSLTTNEDDTTTFGTLVSGDTSVPSASVSQPENKEGFSWSVGQVGTKVTSTKDGFSGKVVKTNDATGYSLVQSADGTKKLWRKMSTLKVDENQGDSSIPTSTSTPTPDPTPADVPSAPDSGEPVNLTNETFALADALADINGELDPISFETSDILDKMNTDPASVTPDDYDALESEVNAALSNVEPTDDKHKALYAAWKALDAKFAETDDFTPPTPPKTDSEFEQASISPDELDNLVEDPEIPNYVSAAENLIEELGGIGFAPEDISLSNNDDPDSMANHLNELVSTLGDDIADAPEVVDAINELAHVLGIETPQIESSKWTPVAVSSLNVGDTIAYMGKSSEITDIAKVGVNYKAMIKDSDGSMSFVDLVTSSPALLIKKGASPENAPDPFPGMDTKTVDEISIGDWVMTSLDAKPMKVTDKLETPDGIDVDLEGDGTKGGGSFKHNTIWAVLPPGESFEQVDVAPETAQETPEPVAEVATPVPGSSHVFSDSKGKYVVNKQGHKLYEGATVTSTKDGFSGTITQLELGAPYAKVKGADGKTKARNINTLAPSDGSAPTATPPTAQVPAAPVATPDAPASPSVDKSSLIQVNTVKPPAFKPGDIVGKDKKTIATSGPSQTLPGKWSISYTDNPSAVFNVSQKNDWEVWGAPKPVEITHEPLAFTTDDGFELTVPPAGKVYKHSNSSYGYLVQDGWGNWSQYKPNSGQGQEPLNGVPHWILSNSTLVGENPNVPDLSVSPLQDVPAEELQKFVGSLSKYVNNPNAPEYYKGGPKALLDILSNPDAELKDAGELSNAAGAVYQQWQLESYGDEALPEVYRKPVLQFLQLKGKKELGTYPNEWAGAVSGGQYHYNANERKALAAIGLSDSAVAFVTEKHLNPYEKPDAAAEIHAVVSDPARADVIDNLFGKGTADGIAKKTKGGQFKEALSGNSSPYAKKVPALPSAPAKNGQIVYLGDYVIASDGQGGQVVLVNQVDGKVRVRRADGTHFMRKATQFTQIAAPDVDTAPGAPGLTPLSTPKPTPAPAPFKLKPRPAYEVQDFAENIGGTSTVMQALDKIKESATAGNRGWSFAADAEQIEDMDVHVSRVLSPQGEELIELKFKVTPKHGEYLFKAHSLSDGWTEANTAIEGRQPSATGGLSQLNGTTVYSSYKGRTLTRVSSTGTTIKFHHATTKTNSTSGQAPTAFHNMMQIRLPANATTNDITKAMYDAGIDVPGPAKPEAFKRFGENRLLSIFAQQTNAYAETTGAQRDTLLEKVKNEWGVTWEQMEVAHGSNGRFELRFPEAVTQKIIAKTKVNYFSHSFSGGVKRLIDSAKSPHSALLSTTVRRTEGVKADGISSNADISTGGADYLFTRPRSNTHGLNGQLVFPASRMLRRSDFWANKTDKYGARTTNGDVIGSMYDGAHETMFKHRMDYDDAIGYVVANETERQNIIAQFKAAGVTMVGSRTVEEFIVVNSNIPDAIKNMPAPSETTPISATLGGPAL